MSVADTERSPTAADPRPPAAQALRARPRLLAAGFLLGGVLGYAGSWLVTPTFQSSTVFIPPQQQGGGAAGMLASSLGALSSLIGGGKSPVEQYVTMMHGTTVSDRVIERFGLAKVYGTEYKAQTRKALSKHVQIAAGKKDGLITVEVEDVDPKRASAMANDYVEELRLLTSHLAVTEAQQRRVFFERLLEDTKTKLVAAQVALQGSGVNEGAIKAEPRAAAEVFARLNAELTAAQVRLQVLRSTLADGAPQVQVEMARVQSLREQVARAGANQSPEAGSPDYIGRYREFKYQEALFELYSKQ